MAKKQKSAARTYKKIAEREHERLGAQNVATTKHFWQSQTFGKASPCYRINPETGEKTLIAKPLKVKLPVRKRKKWKRPAAPVQHPDRDKMMQYESRQRIRHLREL